MHYMQALGRFLQSGANWCGLALATLALVLTSLGLAQWGAAVLAVLGYATGWVVGGLWLGFPKLHADPWDALVFDDQGDVGQSMVAALDAVRQLAQNNPRQRLSAPLQAKVLALVAALGALREQWERSRGQLSLEESFHACHIATSYLPDALKTYLAIPPAFAQTKRLSNGQTAQDTLEASLDELGRKVSQLGEDLASQDAQAFLNHSRFLQEKFNAPRLGPN